MSRFINEHNSSRPSEIPSYSDLMSDLRDCSEGDIVYNSDYNKLKERVGKVIETSQRIVKDIFLGLERDGEERNSPVVEDNLYYGNFYFHQLGSFRKKIDKVVKGFGECETTKVAELVYEDLLPMCELLLALKGRAVKTRKPSSKVNPNARTIENTGTCGCCGKNVKMKSGKLVDHGFELHGWGGRTSGCFGVGYEPVEISPKSMVEYLAYLEATLERLRSEEPNSLERKQRIEAQIWGTEGHVRYLKPRIESWKPSELPKVVKRT
jgi:hypothetical protein